ncbi:F-box/kelch-repeat protein At3g06240-like, partial [Jatropha curcas]|uniref:F-box/kelch-repeat protein At3g06240-like n=1 Tax=Jatropha curcas TaxID=180498 RepID=UPI0009D79A13
SSIKTATNFSFNRKSYFLFGEVTFLSQDSNVLAPEEIGEVTAEEELRVKLKSKSNLGVSVQGSCDGLVLLAFSSGSCEKTSISILWNPSTRETRVITNPPLDPDGTKWKHGFGYDSSIDDYKLLRIFLPANEKGEGLIFRIFALRTNSWKTIDHQDYYQLKGNVGLPNRPILFLNGALHFLVKHKPAGSSAIISYDLSGNKFQETLLPESDKCIFSGIK